MQQLQRFFKLTDCMNRTLNYKSDPTKTMVLDTGKGTPGVFVCVGGDTEFGSEIDLHTYINHLIDRYNITWYDIGIMDFFPREALIFYYAMLFTDFGRVLLIINPKEVELLW